MDLRIQQLTQYIDFPHFKMEGLHKLPSLHQQKAYLIKVDLKDAYLTVPVAESSWPLLAFQNQRADLYQFKFLPFGLCTAPYIITKLTKPIFQFPHSTGIQTRAETALKSSGGSYDHQ